jgi:hypothetical protein
MYEIYAEWPDGTPMATEEFSAAGSAIARGEELAAENDLDWINIVIDDGNYDPVWSWHRNRLTVTDDD